MTTSLTDAQRDLWKKVVIKFMSSEKSGEEEIGNGEMASYKPLLRWRTPKVNRFFNSLYTEFHFLQVLMRLLIPCMSRIFCYELALETSAKYSSIKSLRVHDLCHAHSLVSL